MLCILVRHPDTDEELAEINLELTGGALFLHAFARPEIGDTDPTATVPLAVLEAHPYAKREIEPQRYAALSRPREE